MYEQKIYNFSPKNSQKLQINQKQKEILTILDQLYLQYRRIPNIYSIFLTYPKTFQNLFQFQQSLIVVQKSTKTNLPLTHKYYLGIIGASTFGCRYLWNMMAQKFIKAGGDINWLQQGRQQTPKYLQKLSQMSYIIAYNFKIGILEQKCFQLCDQKQFNSALLIEGLYILSYYHFLACVSLIHGLIPEENEYQKYLPQIPNLSPSMDSFQTMKKASKKQQVHEKELAEQFTQMYSWDEHSNQFQKQKSVQVLQKSNSFNHDQIKRLKISQMNKSSNQSLTQYRDQRERLDSQNEIVVIVQEEQILSKIKNSKTLKNIEAVFHKYVPFDQRMSGIEFKHKKKSRNSNVEYGSTELIEIEKQKSQSDYDFIYASEWSFQNNATKRIQSVLGKSVNKNLKNVLNSLRFLSKEKRKNLKIYYESLQNYMYQYVKYIQLMSQGVSLVQKNYIKLITRSPFLFNQKSYTKMKEDIQKCCQIQSPLEFVIQILSYKLQMNFSLITYFYDKFIQNQQ